MNRKAGFTIMELLVVSAIIAVLVAITVVFVGSAQKKGRDAKRDADISEIKKALELYVTDNNIYPTNGVANPMVIGTTEDYLSDALVEGGHISTVNPDPINTAPYVYTYQPSAGANNYKLEYCYEAKEENGNPVCVLYDTSQ